MEKKDITKEHHVARRDVIKGIGAGLAILSAPSVFASLNKTDKSTDPSTSDLSDPRDKYPKPPFKSQLSDERH